MLFRLEPLLLALVFKHTHRAACRVPGESAPSRTQLMEHCAVRPRHRWAPSDASHTRTHCTCPARVWGCYQSQTPETDLELLLGENWVTPHLPHCHRMTAPPSTLTAVSSASQGAPCCRAARHAWHAQTRCACGAAPHAPHASSAPARCLSWTGGWRRAQTFQFSATQRGCAPRCAAANCPPACPASCCQLLPARLLPAFTATRPPFRRPNCSSPYPSACLLSGQSGTSTRSLLAAVQGGVPVAAHGGGVVPLCASCRQPRRPSLPCPPAPGPMLPALPSSPWAHPYSP